MHYGAHFVLVVQVSYFGMVNQEGLQADVSLYVRLVLAL